MERSDTPWPSRPHEPNATLRTEQLFGLGFIADATLDDVVEMLIAPPPTDGPALVVTPNVDHVVRYARDPDAAAVAHRATLVLPDGAPLVWASRLLRRRLRRRLAGSDLFPLLWERLIATDRPAVVLGPNEAVRAGLSAQHPSAVVLTAPVLPTDHANGVGADGDEATLERICNEVADAVRSSGSAHVLVAVGFPATHRVAARLLDDLSARGVWIVLIGAAPEFHLGLQRRAPLWMQRAGVEWLHRFAREPRRMWRRYLLGGPRFAQIVWLDRTPRSRRRV